ncbi:MAG TPA: YraN family protein [Candidatus Brocadiaceae bacterium]|nr:YraN family protein [Candidatus Brocadiaceae bacterium]
MLLSLRRAKRLLSTVLGVFTRRVEEPPGKGGKKAIGAEGERIAVRFLKKKGYKILQRNYRSKGGEIDIICYDHGCIVFVEVKTRFSNAYGAPELAVNEAKRRQIIKTASHYTAQKKIEGVDLRFDVVSIFHSPDAKRPAITLFKNAFTKDDC